MTITTPKYSFVNFSSDVFKLLVKTGDTITFQVRMDSGGLASHWAASFQTTKGTAVTTTNVSVATENTLLNVSLKVTGTLTHGEHYQVKLVYDDTVNAAETFTSNTFVNSTVQSEVVIYNHHADFMDFGYETTITPLRNQVRLPIHIHNYQPSSITDQYQKSTGAFVTFGTFVNDTYRVETDYQNAAFHRCMQAMLLHRTITLTIDNQSRTAQIFEDYSVEYSQNVNYGKAKGVTRISLT